MPHCGPGRTTQRPAGPGCGRCQAAAHPPDEDGVEELLADVGAAGALVAAVDGVLVGVVVPVVGVDVLVARAARVGVLIPPVVAVAGKPAPRPGGPAPEGRGTCYMQLARQGRPVQGTRRAVLTWRHNRGGACQLAPAARSVGVGVARQVGMPWRGAHAPSLVQAAAGIPPHGCNCACLPNGDHPRATAFCKAASRTARLRFLPVRSWAVAQRQASRGA